MKKAKIKIIGERQHVVVSEVVGRGIDQSLTNREISDDAYISISPDVKRRKREISGVTFYEHVDEEALADQRKQEKEEGLRRMDAEYHDYRRQKLAMSPQMRGRSLHFFALLFWAYTGQEVPVWFEPIVQKWQAEFFEENPQRILPDPAIFRSSLEIIARDYPEWYVADGKPNKNALVNAAFRTVERSVALDMRYAG